MKKFSQFVHLLILSLGSASPWGDRNLGVAVEALTFGMNHDKDETQASFFTPGSDEEMIIEPRELTEEKIRVVARAVVKLASYEVTLKTGASGTTDFTSGTGQGRTEKPQILIGFRPVLPDWIRQWRHTGIPRSILEGGDPHLVCEPAGEQQEIQGGSAADQGVSAEKVLVTQESSDKIGRAAKMVFQGEMPHLQAEYQAMMNFVTHVPVEVIWNNREGGDAGASDDQSNEDQDHSSLPAGGVQVRLQTNPYEVRLGAQLEEALQKVPGGVGRFRKLMLKMFERDMHLLALRKAILTPEVEITPEDLGDVPQPKEWKNLGFTLNYMDSKGKAASQFAMIRHLKYLNANLEHLM